MEPDKIYIIDAGHLALSSRIAKILDMQVEMITAQRAKELSELNNFVNRTPPHPLEFPKLDAIYFNPPPTRAERRKAKRRNSK